MFSVFLLALALSVDAFAVAFSYGLVIKKDVASSAAKLGAATGAGQFVMPLLGWLATDSVHRYIEAFDHWIAFVVFLLLGLNVIRGALGGEECEKPGPKLSLKLLSVVAVATSIVAAAALIGAVCFVCTVAGFYFSRVFCRLPTACLQIAAGCVLILLGVKVLYEHLS